MSRSPGLNLNNILLFLFLCLFLSRQEIFIIPIKGQRPLMVLIFLISIHILLTKNLSVDFFRKGKYILFSIMYLLFIYFIGFGDKGDLLDLLLTYITAASFFIIGLFWGQNNRTLFLKRFILILFILSFINLIPFVFNSLITGAIHKRSLSEFYGLERNPMIMFWPYIFIIGFVGYFMSKPEIKKKLHKYIITFLFVVYFLTLVVSAFTSVVLMLTFALTLLAFFKFKEKINPLHIIRFAVIIAIIIFGLKSVGEGAFGELGGTSDKVKSVFAMFQSSNSESFEENLETASATRYSRLDLSYHYINKSPVVGNGYYFSSVGTDINKKVASNHSSIIDFWAYFGIFAIPFFLIFINFITISYKFGNKSSGKNKQMGYIICAVITTYFLISFANPYLQFSSIDLIFLLGGWVISQYSLLEKRGSNYKIKKIEEDNALN